MRGGDVTPDTLPQRGSVTFDPIEANYNMVAVIGGVTNERVQACVECTIGCAR